MAVLHHAWVLAAAALLFAPAAPAEAVREIRIGMVNAQTGPAAALGRGMLAGARAVFDDVNARGGVHGRRIALRVADDGYEPDQTVEQTLKLVQDEKVLTLFGYVGTPTTNAVLPLLAELDVPLVGVFSGAASLRVPGLRHVFNLRASYDQESEALVDHLLAGGAKRIGVVYQNDGFGLSGLSGTEQALQRRGLVLAGRAAFQRNTVAIRLALAAMRELEPDAVVIVGPYMPVAAFIEQSREMGLKSTFATLSFVGTESLVAQLGRGAHDVIVSQVVPPPGDASIAVARDCARLLAARGSESLGYVSFEGCVSAKLLVAALQAAGPQVARQALMRALDSLASIDLGDMPLSLAPGRHQASDRVYLTRLDGGRVLPVR